jgi:NAD(P)-dependent dehydrogenase (short-subunit alcohol dehydrogenase family)
MPTTQNGEHLMETILITGANRGIGLELTRGYAQSQRNVIACCRDPEAATELQKLASEHEGVEVQQVHVSDGDSVAALAARVGDRPIDMLINNAGTPGPGPQDQGLANMDFDGWADAFAVNTMAPLRILQAFRSNLAAGSNPRAVTVTSQMGAIGLDMPVMFAYCSSKGAVNKLMRLASFELKNDGVAVVLVHPGWVKTDMGGPGAQITPEESAAGLIEVLDGVSLDDSPCFKTYAGDDHVW